MTPAETKRTRADALRDQMRDDILSGALKPGQRLMFPDLSSRYGASVGVTREALAGLVSQGLVRASAHQGYMVTPLSKTDLHDLVVARCMVESLVIEASVNNGGVEWEAQVVAAHHVLTRAHAELSDSPQTNARWSQAHSMFHEALFAACGNAKLLDITRFLGESAALYRRWSDSIPDGRDVLAEHRALLDAALSGNATEAADLLRTHLQATEKALVHFAED
jgi:DNA-binding GntR family transcriptional regulator